MGTAPGAFVCNGDGFARWSLSFGCLWPSPGMLPRSSKWPLALNRVSCLISSSTNTLCNSYSKSPSAWRSQTLGVTPFLPWIFQYFPPSSGLYALLPLFLNARSVTRSKRNCQWSTLTHVSVPTELNCFPEGLKYNLYSLLTKVTSYMSPEFHFDPFSMVVKKRRFRNSRDKLFGGKYLTHEVSFL